MSITIVSNKEIIELESKSKEILSFLCAFYIEKMFIENSHN